MLSYCTHMFNRALQHPLIELAKKYPVVTVTGPKQSGKTTLVCHTFADKPYANLEAPDIRHMAKTDPRGFLRQFPNGAVLDEIQHSPELLSYIQVMVDKLDKNNIFTLTSSHQLLLHQAISQSLAGRTALLTLFPMSLNEISNAGFNYNLDKHILYGGYTRIYKENIDPTTSYRNYYHTYIQRDVRQLINVKNMSAFEKFIKLCAGRIGSIF